MTPRREDAIAAELRWYWAAAEGEMGLKSNFEAICARIRLGVGLGGKLMAEMDERCIEAATRERHVRRALVKVSDRDAAILVHAFGPDTREIPVFGRATGVVPLTRVARDTWANSGTTRTLEDWLARLVVRVHTGRGNDPDGDVDLLKAIGSEAEQMLQGALQAYAAYRHPGKPAKANYGKDREGKRAA